MALVRRTAAVTAVVAAAEELADVGLLTPANLALAADYDQEALKAAEVWVGHQVSKVEASDRARADRKHAAALARIQAHEEKARVRYRDAGKDARRLGEQLRVRRDGAVPLKTREVPVNGTDIWRAPLVYADPTLNKLAQAYQRALDRESAAEKEIPLARERAGRELNELEESETPPSAQFLWLSQLQIAVTAARREAMIWHLQARKTALRTTEDGPEAPRVL